MKIGRRLQVSTLLSVAAVAGIGLFLIVSFHKINKISYGIKKSNEILKEVFELNILTNHWLLYHDDRSRSQIGLKIKSLEHILSLEKHAHDEEQALHDKISGHCLLIKQTLLKLFDNYKKYESEINKPIYQRINQRLISRLLLSMQQLVSHTLDHVKDDQELMFKIQARTYFIIIASIIFLAITIGLISLLTARSIVNPLIKLSKDIEVIGSGNLDHRVGMDSQDEIGQLSRSFDQMVVNLKKVTASRSELQEEIHRRRLIERELERSNKELEQFAYVASHDLQEPLRIITGYMQLLEKRYKGKLDEDADRFIKHAVEGAARMKGLITDILAYSRVSTRGKFMEPTDCDQVLQIVLTNLKMAIEEAGAQVTSFPLPTVMTDSTQLGQLFQNLISNAIKFKGEEPPHVQISANNVDISEIGLPQHRMQKGWIFSVSDNGIGIKTEYAERIFGIFQQLHTRSEYPGTGIGLAICQKIVERHGGKIWVESKEGEGSTFYFTLPDGGGSEE